MEAFKKLKDYIFPYHVCGDVRLDFKILKVKYVIDIDALGKEKI